MVPSGPPTPVGGAQSVPPSLLRSNSALLGGGQPGSLASQQQYSSLVSPRSQFSGNNNGGSMSLLGNIPNVSSLLNHSFANGTQNSGGGRASGDMLGSGGADPMSFSSSSGVGQGQHFQNPSAAQDYASHVTQSQQMDGMQSFHQQLSGPHNQQLRGGFGGGMGPVKMESQAGGADQNGPSQQLQSMRNLGGVKLEPQQLQSVRSLGPMKLERQLSDSSMFLQQQQQQQHQQQQQYLQMSRHSTHAAAAQINLLHQQRMMQLQQQQQQQQQQMLKAMPQQRNQLQQQQQQLQQQQQQLQQQMQQGLPGRLQGKPMMYEPGMCARRLTHYMYQQQHRPEDNNIQFWRNFVAEYFAPNAKKRWCVSLYGSGRQTTGVFPQDIWHCEICNRKPGRGFETTVEVLPRLFQIKYASGTLEELLYVDMPREYQNASGQIVLDYNKAIQESVFDQLRVVREGQLRIVFSPELKISSWEFCARRHEELIPRRLLIPQVSQLGAVVQKYQQATSNASSTQSAQDLQNTCNSFVASARQVAKTLEVPLVNDLGYTKRYVRCLQISEVVNSMKDLIDYSRETGTGPMNSLINFPRRSSGSTGLHGQQPQQPEDQQSMSQNQSHNGQNAVHAPGIHLASVSTGVTSLNNSLNIPSTTSLSSTSIAGLLHQNSMNPRQENHMSNANNPYGSGNSIQIPSASSSSAALLQTQPNPSSPFPSPTPSTSTTIPTPTSHGNANLNSSNSPANMPGMQHQTTQTPETDPTDSQSSVQQILQDLMMSPQMNGVTSLGNEMRGVRGITPGINGGNSLIGNGMANGPSVAGMGFGGMSSSANANGLRAAMTNNVMSMHGRVGVSHVPHDPMAMNNQQQQQDMGNRLLSGLGSANSFNNLQFDWKPSP